MSKRKAIRAVLFIFGAALGLLGLWWLLSAHATAHLRFGHCGATSLDHPEAYCQVGMRLLYQSFATLAASTVLLVAAIYIGRRRERAA